MNSQLIELAGNTCEAIALNRQHRFNQLNIIGFVGRRHAQWQRLFHYTVGRKHTKLHIEGGIDTVAHLSQGGGTHFIGGIVQGVQCLGHFNVRGITQRQTQAMD